MKKLVIVLGLAVTGLTACNNFEKGEGDMLFKIHTDKPGEKIKEGDFIAFKAIEKTEGDSVLYSSYDYDRASLLVKEKSVFKGDLFAALGLLSEGDSATFKINIDSMVQKMGRPQPSDTTKKYLIYNVKIDKVIPKGTLSDSLFRAKIDEYLKLEMEQAKTTEATTLKAYVSSKSLKPTVTASGLNYIISKEGTGAKANPGDTVVVNYTGMFLSGKVFDSSENAGHPISFKANQVIKGWTEILQLMPVGSTFEVYIPSDLAYGTQAVGSVIGPNETLIFNIHFPFNIIRTK